MWRIKERIIAQRALFSPNMALIQKKYLKITLDREHIFSCSQSSNIDFIFRIERRRRAATVVNCSAFEIFFRHDGNP